MLGTQRPILGSRRVGTDIGDSVLEVCSWTFARTRSAGGVLGARLGAFIEGSERLSGSGSGSEHEGSSFSSRGRSDVRTIDSLVRQPAAPADARRHGHAWPAGRDAARLYPLRPQLRRLPE